MNITSTNTKRFLLFLIGYFTVIVLIRLMVSPTATLDETEQIICSKFFAWGYYTQPPLYTWLQMLVFKFLDTSILGLAILKFFILFLAYIYVYKIALLLTGNETKAILSSLSLMLFPRVIWESQIELIHTVLLTTATAITIYYFFKILLKKVSVIDFVFLGIAIGIGFLAKYNYVLVITSLVITALLVTDYRKIFLDKRLLISIIIVTVMVLPHFFWFINNLDIATAETVEKMTRLNDKNHLIQTLGGLATLFTAVIAFLTPFWCVFILLFRKDTKWTRNNETLALVLYISISIIILTLLILSGHVSKIKGRWLQPYLIFCPILFFTQIELKDWKQNTKTYLKAIMLAAVIVIIATLFRTYGSDFRKKPSKTNYPYEKIANILKEKIDEQTVIYTKDQMLGGNLLLLLPDANVIVPPFNNTKPKQNKILFVSSERYPLPVGILDTDQYNCEKETFSAPFRFSSKFIYNIDATTCSKRQL